MPVRVLIVDDTTVVRKGLRALLEVSPQVEVVGEAADGRRAVELAHELRPDLVLMDVRMPRMDGVSAAREIVDVSRVLMMTFTDDPDTVREAMEAGASGYLVHGSFDADSLLGSVIAVALGSGVFSADAVEALRGPSAIPPTTDAAPDGPPRRTGNLGLSERQREIMDLIASGLTNGEIARHCFLSEKTVKNHINRIFAVLGVRNRAEAVSLWLGGRTVGTSR